MDRSGGGSHIFIEFFRVTVPKTFLFQHVVVSVFFSILGVSRFCRSFFVSECQKILLGGDLVLQKVLVLEIFRLLRVS